MLTNYTQIKKLTLQTTMQIGPNCVTLICGLTLKSTKKVQNQKNVEF